MKLWRISQQENSGYDTWDSAVVAAETQEDARLWHPGYEEGKLAPDDERWTRSYGSWAHWKCVSAKYLGEARPGHPEGIVVASFNAG